MKTEEILKASNDMCGHKNGIYTCYLKPGHDGRHVSRGFVAWAKQSKEDQ